MATVEVPDGGTFRVAADHADVGAPADIGLRIDRIRFAEASAPGTGFTGIVSNVEYRGSSVKITVMGAGADDFTVVVRRPGFLRPADHAGRCRAAQLAFEEALLLGASTDITCFTHPSS